MSNGPEGFWFRNPARAALSEAHQVTDVEWTAMRSLASLYHQTLFASGPVDAALLDQAKASLAKISIDEVVVKAFHFLHAQGLLLTEPFQTPDGRPLPHSVPGLREIHMALKPESPLWQRQSVQQWSGRVSASDLGQSAVISSEVASGKPDIPPELYPAYLNQIKLLMLNQHAYPLLFKPIEVSPVGMVVSGHRRALALAVLGPSFIETFGLNNWIYGKVLE